MSALMRRLDRLEERLSLTAEMNILVMSWREDSAIGVLVCEGQKIRRAPGEDVDSFFLRACVWLDDLREAGVMHARFMWSE